VKVIYIAGKYRAKTEWDLIENIRHAEQAAIQLWQQGWSVICPHKNTSHFGGLCEDSVWLDGDLEIMKRCDAVYALKGWEDSIGATIEVDVARQLGMEIIYEDGEK
jgi:hypothetical protein